MAPLKEVSAEWAVRGPVAVPAVKQKKTRGVFVSLNCNISHNIRLPVSSSLTQCQAEHRGGKSTSEGHISLFSKGKRDGAERCRQQSPAPTTFPNPVSTLESVQLGDTPAQGRTGPNNFSSFPKQSRNQGVSHSFDLQFEACFFSQGFKEISC